MKTQCRFLAVALLVGGLACSTYAQDGATRKPRSREKVINEFIQIEIKNFQDETLGRIMDLGIDLINGRIVEVLVETDSSLDVGGKIVAVPPLALFRDPDNKVFRLNVSAELFKSAMAIDLVSWEEAGRSDRVAAAYYLFGQEPYFLEEGDTASRTAARPKVSLGYVERCNRMLGLPVGNHQDVQFGEVWSMTLDILKGRIINVIVLAPGNFKTKSIIPAMALSFNAKRDALLLDDTKLEYADEPRYFYTEAAYGNEASYQREAYRGPRTQVALEQGSSFRDMDMTVRLYKEIRAAKVSGRQVEAATLNDRVTLRGWVPTAEERQRIADIAGRVTRPEMVDNQITVGKPAKKN